MRTLWLILIAIASSAERSSAQATIRPAPGSGRLWVAIPPPPPGLPSDGIFGDGSNDYRYQGFWIGAGLGIGLSYIGYQFCTHSDTACEVDVGGAVLRTALASAMLGTIGALAGAQFDR